MTMHAYTGRVLHVDPDHPVRVGAHPIATDEHRVPCINFLVCIRTSQSENMWPGHIDRSVMSTVQLGACSDC